MFPKVQVNLKEEGEKHTPGKKEENKEKFLQQYGSQRTIIETFQEQPQKETQRKVYPDN